MAKMIFVNLPVGHLTTSLAFYSSLGFRRNPAFSNDQAACMVWSEEIYVMIHSIDSWRRFTQAPLPQPGSQAMSLAINVDSREDVDALVAIAGANGGAIDVNPPEDHGFMYQRSLTDPDGHLWEPFWMDPKAAAEGPPDMDQPV